MAKRRVDAFPRTLIAVVGTDGAVIALGWPSGAQGGMSPLMREEAAQIRAYLDRYLSSVSGV